MRASSRSRRGAARGEGHLEARQFDIAKRAGWEAGTFAFKNGHSAIYTDQPGSRETAELPADGRRSARAIGKLRADWMLKLRNTHIFPNLQIADAISRMVRTFRPLAVDLTEMRSYCLAPIGEPRNLRAWRLRQFEDFFNPSGFATPDDAVIYEECQRGFRAKSVDWLQGYERGIGRAGRTAPTMSRRRSASTSGGEPQGHVPDPSPKRRSTRRIANGGG